MSKSTQPFPGPQRNLPFIVSSNPSQVDHATRKLIRSHVMRGKNVKRGKRQSPPVSEVASPASPARRSQAEIQDMMNLYSSPPPERLGARLYFIGFPEDVEPRLFFEMEQVSSVALQILFPLLVEIGFQADKKPWLHPAERDSVALYIDAFATQTFIDRVLRHQPESEVNQVATLHLQKGLTLLRERMGGLDDNAKISDATIGAVLDLATAALFHGDANTAKQHIRGLGKMTDLRGGLKAFDTNPGLLMEILRCDISIALFTATEPIFCCRTGAKLPNFPDQVLSSFDSAENPGFLNALNPDLAEVWRVTRKFCLLVNLATQTRRQFHPSLIYDSMTSIMYRLLRMVFTNGSRDEALRLGLLVFTQHIFLQGQQIRLPSQSLSQWYRIHLKAIETKLDSQRRPKQVTLWLLMVGAISLYNLAEEAWLGESLGRWIERCRVGSWKDLQDVLKSCMWIPALDDRVGQQVYESIFPS